LPFRAARHFGTWGGKGPQLRSHANQEADYAYLKQIPLRQAYADEYPPGDVNVREPPTNEREPTDVIGNSSDQLKSSEVAHGDYPPLGPVWMNKALKLVQSNETCGFYTKFPPSQAKTNLQFVMGSSVHQVGDP
jgi:hypothetical protein